MFSCGWLPPVGGMHAGFMAEFGVGAYSTSIASAPIDFRQALGALGAAVDAQRHMVVRGQFRNVECVRGFAAALAQGKAVAHVGGHAALEIGQGEVDASVTAVSGAQQRKQGLVLVDGQQLAIAERPALGRKIEAHDLDFR